jgi:hypothetical protein
MKSISHSIAHSFTHTVPTDAKRFYYNNFFKEKKKDVFFYSKGDIFNLANRGTFLFWFDIFPKDG